MEDKNKSKMNAYKHGDQYNAQLSAFLESNPITAAIGCSNEAN